jgi:predicted enzyme related to lactoylglutathione lyase
MMAQVSVRYIVDDVVTAIAFYTELFGFDVQMHPAPTFAALTRDDLRLLLNAPTGPGGAARPARDGRRPEPGGWARMVLDVTDLDAEVARLRDAGATLRTDLVEGVGGRQVVVDDPSGNAVELFEPA